MSPDRNDHYKEAMMNERQARLGSRRLQREILKACAFGGSHAVRKRKQPASSAGACSDGAQAQTRAYANGTFFRGGAEVRRPERPDLVWRRTRLRFRLRRTKLCWRHQMLSTSAVATLNVRVVWRAWPARASKTSPPHIYLVP